MYTSSLDISRKKEKKCKKEYFNLMRESYIALGNVICLKNKTFNSSQRKFQKITFSEKEN